MSMWCYFESRPGLRDFKSQISDFKSRAESCSRQIRGWAESLQNSDITGQRHLNDRTRKLYEQRKDSEQCRQSFETRERELLGRMPSNHPARLQWERRNGPLKPE